MIKVGVLSDTHITRFSKGMGFLEKLNKEYFRESDIILHAGDMVDPDILLGFGGKTVHAVRGNMDPPVPGIPDRKIIEIGGFRIGLIHGWGPPDNLEERVLNAFAGEGLDALVFGHSHQPLCQRRKGILLLNPGSPTDRRWAPYHSIGLLTLTDEISGEIIRIDD